VLQNNAGGNLAVAAGSSTFTFPTALNSGSKYAVTVLTQPSNPSQTCTVSNGSGTLGSANVTTIAIACSTTTITPSSFTIGGSISGLSGSGLVLQDNGGDDLALGAGSKSFTFSTKLPSASRYAVTVKTQPSNPSQTCTVGNGSGTLGSANVTTIAIACSTTTITPSSYTIGGSISGLSGSGLVLQDNGGDSLTVAAGRNTFTFPTALVTGSNYAVTVLTSPSNPSQTCTLSNGSGRVGSANVTTVAVTCASITYTIGGTVTGLAGTGLVLQNNGGDDLSVPPASGGASTTFTFATALTAGSSYAVTVSSPPAGPAQLCSVANGSGTVPANNVSNVQIACVKVGRFVFVANNSDGTQGDVSAFTIDPLTGALSSVSGSPFLTDIGPSAVVVDTTGQFVYVSNGASKDVSRMLLDSTGSLTLQGQFSTATSATASLAITPSDAFLYTVGHGTAAAGTIYGFAVDATSGSLTGVSTQPFAFTNPQLAVAIDPTSHLVFSAADPHFLYVNSIAADGTLSETLSSGASTAEGATGVAVWPKGGAAGGYVYTTDQVANSVSVFSYDSQGVVTALTPAAAGHGTMGIAMDPAGKFLYVTNFADGTLSAYAIDAQTGELTSLGPDVATGNVNGAANPGPIDAKIDPSSQFLYCVNKNDGSVSVFTIDANGALHLFQTYSTGLDGRGAGSNAVAVY
jgi:6-phosphogluconolactonase (cycloisomerase 2 family)